MQQWHNPKIAYSIEVKNVKTTTANNGIKRGCVSANPCAGIVGCSCYIF
jgi:hypothetical protein